MEIKLTVDLSDRTYELGQQLLEAVKGGAAKIDSAVMGQSHRHFSPANEVKVKQKEVQEELPFAETEIVETETKPKRATRATKAAKEESKEEVVNELKAKKVEEPKEEPKEEASGKDALQDMRALLRTKINDGNNREEIRHKLVSLGANNLTTLAPKHYDEMMAFLQAL